MTRDDGKGAERTAADGCLATADAAGGGSAFRAGTESGGPGALTATKAVGPGVWHSECWDRYIRDEKHFVQTKWYIENNPVAASLVATVDAWRWSSAHPGSAGLRTGPDDAAHANSLALGDADWDDETQGVRRLLRESEMAEKSGVSWAGAETGDPGGQA